MSLEQADKVFSGHQYAEALELYRKASADPASQVEALSQIARCHSLLGKLDEGRPILEKAGKLASRDEPLGFSRYLGVRGIFERESGEEAKAKATFIEMADYCREKGQHRRAVDAYHLLAILVPPAEQPGWALKGIAEAEKLKDERWLAVLWNNLGATYEDLRQYDKCLETYLKARELHYKTGGDRQKIAADWTVGHAYRLTGQLKPAKEWLERALAAALAWKDPSAVEWVGWCKKDLAEVLGDLPLLNEARVHLVEAGIDKDWPVGMAQVDAAIKALESSLLNRGRFGKMT